jgi:hypothetical protein
MPRSKIKMRHLRQSLENEIRTREREQYFRTPAISFENKISTLAEMSLILKGTAPKTCAINEVCYTAIWNVNVVRRY